jgi:hypothetical protein
MSLEFYELRVKMSEMYFYTRFRRNGFFRIYTIVGRLLGFTNSMEFIKSLSCFEYVAIIDGYAPLIILMASAFTFCASNALRRLHISYKIQPRDQISLL